MIDGVKALVPRAAEAELFVVAAQLPSGTPGLFIVEPGTAGITVEPDPGIGVRAAATARLTLHEVAVPAGALLGEGAPDAYRGLRRARPPRVVRAGDRHRAGRARLRRRVREVPPGVRRAGRQPPGGRVHRREHGDRARGTAAGHLPRRGPRRPGSAVPPRGRDRPPAAGRPRHAARLRRRADARRPRLHARSTRSSAGTATCAPRACWKGGSWYDDQPRGPQEVRPADRTGAPGRSRGAAPELPPLRHRRARAPQGARHARRADRRHERGRPDERRRCERHGLARRRRFQRRRAPTPRRPATGRTWRRCSG